MTTYISQLDVSMNNVDEQNLRKQGFTQLKENLNKGACGNQIYLWYKKGPTAITRLQVSFNADMATGMTKAGYAKIDKDLNTGAGGNNIYLWYYQGSGEYDTPIVNICITTEPKNEAAKFGLGWHRLACDLNRNGGGAWIHIWVKREKETYICDISATDSYGSDTDLFGGCYIRVDEDTNRGAGGSKVFIWYRQTTHPKRALTVLQVSISDEEAYAFQQQGYESVDVNLNDKTSCRQVYLWYKKGGCNNPIQAIALLVNTALIKDYSKAGLIVIGKNLNAGNDGYTEFLCVYQ